MIAIKEARFNRLIPNGGELYGEVKVLPEGERGAFLAWFAPDGRGGFRLEKLIRKEEELELDWYDNDLHHAFEDVTESRLSDGAEQSAFVERLLAYGTVRDDMRKRFAEQAAGYDSVLGTAGDLTDITD